MLTVGFVLMVTVPSAVALPHWLLLMAVTVKVPAVVGVPVTVPILLLNPLKYKPLDNIAGLELLQLVVVTVIMSMFSPSHTTILLLERLTVGSGLTVMVPVVWASPQLVEVVTKISKSPTVSGVPINWPVVLSKVTPLGRPVTTVVLLNGETESPSIAAFLQTLKE